MHYIAFLGMHAVSNSGARMPEQLTTAPLGIADVDKSLVRHLMFAPSRVSVMLAPSSRDVCRQGRY